MKPVAIIPARKGSKRIPRKNFTDFAGKPMVQYSVEAALRTGLFETIVVSTDDQEFTFEHAPGLLEIHRHRPAELSDDETGIRDVLRYEIKRLADQQIEFQEVCLIYATAPFLSARSLITSYQRFREDDCEFVLGVGKFDPPIQRALQTDERGFLGMIESGNIDRSTQSFDESYYDAGKFCWGSAASFLGDSEVLSGRTLPFLLSGLESIDIDTPDQWRFLESIRERHDTLGESIHD